MSDSKHAAAVLAIIVNQKILQFECNLLCKIVNINMKGNSENKYIVDRAIALLGVSNLRNE